MTDIEREVDSILQHARQGFTPAQADADRVFAKLGPLMTQVDPAEFSAGRAQGSVSAAAVLGRAPAWFGRALVTALIATIFGSGGYWLGFRAGSRQPPLARSPEPQATVMTAAAPAASVKTDSALPAPDAPNDSTQDRPARAGLTATPRTADLVAGEPRDSLQEEVDTLRRVERAQRQHNPRLALSLLSELDLRVPRGKLMEERFAAGTIARCELALAPKDTLLAAFTKRYARSAYADRVARACSKTDLP